MSLTSLLKTGVRRLLGSVISIPLRRAYEGQIFRWVNERPIEYGFLFRMISTLEVKSILDVGTGQTALPHVLRTCGYIVTAIDNMTDYWPQGMLNRHFYVIDDDITRPRLQKKFDLVVCISVLEHIEESDEAVKGILSLLRPGGYAVLTFPYCEIRYLRNAYALDGSSYGSENPYLCQVFSRSELDRWVSDNDAQILVQEYWRVFSGDYWTVGAQLYPRQAVRKTDTHHLTCVLLQARTSE